LVHLRSPQPITSDQLFWLLLGCSIQMLLISAPKSVILNSHLHDDFEEPSLLFHIISLSSCAAVHFILLLAHLANFLCGCITFSSAIQHVYKNPQTVCCFTDGSAQLLFSILRHIFSFVVWYDKRLSFTTYLTEHFSKDSV
jgi:hypothetical protein